MSLTVNVSRNASQIEQLFDWLSFWGHAVVEQWEPSHRHDAYQVIVTIPLLDIRVVLAISPDMIQDVLRRCEDPLGNAKQELQRFVEIRLAQEIARHITEQVHEHRENNFLFNNRIHSQNGARNTNITSSHGHIPGDNGGFNNWVPSNNAFSPDPGAIMDAQEYLGLHGHEAPVDQALAEILKRHLENKKKQKKQTEDLPKPTRVIRLEKIED